MSKYIRLLPLALVAGVIITLLLSSAATWRSSSDCISPAVVLPDGISRAECQGLTYGYPMEYLKVTTHVSLTSERADAASPKVVGSNGLLRVNKTALALNLTLWTTTSYLVLFVISTVRSKRSESS